jgi:predicted transcriptional regulator
LESKKKVLERRKRGRAYVYRPLISRADVSRSMLEGLSQVLFGGSWPSLVLNILSEGSASQADIDALRAALDRVEGTREP